jgi:hypothetical protein
VLPPRVESRAAIAGAVLAAALLTATLWPVDDPSARRGFSWCLLCSRQTLDALFNILAFAPLGGAFVLAGARTTRAVLLGGLLSAAIEALQGEFIPGRHGEATDVLTNTLGTLAGALLIPRWRRWLRPDSAGAAIFVFSSAAALVMVSAATAALLRPSWPEGSLFGQWAPERSPYPPFPGQVLHLEFEGQPIPNDRIAQPDALRAAIASGTFSGRTEVVTGPAAAVNASPIAAIVIGRRDAARFNQSGTDAEFGVRLAGDRIGLRPLELAVPGALPSAGERVVLEGRLSRSRLSAQVSRPAGVVSRRLDLTVGLGWVFLRPVPGPIGDWHALMSCAWLALLTAPLGYYLAVARRAADSARWSMGPAAVVTVTLTTSLWLVPVVAGLAMTPLPQWLSAGGGLVAGAWLGRLVARSPRV